MNPESNMSLIILRDYDLFGFTLQAFGNLAFLSKSGIFVREPYLGHA
jgi:hypothetical protein